MKYSVGITNSKKKKKKSRASKASKKRSFNKAFSPSKFDKLKSFKKYNSKNTKKRKKSPIKTRNVKGKNKELKLKAKKILYVGVGVVFFLGCLALIGMGIYLKNLQNSLPSPDELVDRTSDQSTQIFDKDGKLLYTVYGDQNREFISIDNIPEHTKWALLAAEDIEFYQHKGMDYLSIARAFTQNLMAREVVRGASTITQQLVKTTILYDVLGDEAYSQTYTRKIKEALITMQVEQTFTKDEILQMYMNEVPLGGVNYGFQAAANAYFGKDVEDLTLAESALLAGLIQSPGIYSPLYGTDPDRAKDRQEYVLRQMERNKRLTGVTDEDVEEAREEELAYRSRRIDIDSPHFVFYVKQLLEEEFGVERVERGGLRVTTTLDSSLQKIAEDEVIQGVEGAKNLNVHNGAMVVLDPKTGHVLAMVGSVDYFNIEDPRIDGNVNVALRERQMGSAIKPFVYLAAINRGYGPWLLTPDIPQIEFGNYKPTNWDKGYHGLMTARKALGLSRNVPSVYTLQLAGIDNFLQIIEKVGVTGMAQKVDYGLSLGLGSGEMKLLEFTNAYATIANNGVRNEITPILSVKDSKGEILFEAEENTGVRVVDEKEAYILNWMMCDLGNFNDKLSVHQYFIGGNKLCGKTGTTDGPRDLAAFMYNQNIVVGVWNGNNNNENMPRAWSNTVPLPIANSFLKRVIENYPSGTYNRPAGVLTTSVCTDTGAAPEDGVNCQEEASLYIAGRPPQVDKREMVEICTENGLIPSNLDAARRYGLTEESVVIEYQIENTSQQRAYRQYLRSQDGANYIFSKPDTEVCPLPLGPNNAPVIELEKPTSGQSVVRGQNLEISGHVRYLESISEFTANFGGTNIADASLNEDSTFVINYFVPSDTSLGSHTVTIAVVDNFSKTDSRNVQVEVVSEVSSITVSLASPADGATLALSAFPITLSASVSGGTVDEVTFNVSKVGGGYNESFTDTNGANGWNQQWANSGVSSGNYRITVTAKAGGSDIAGNPITVGVD